MTPRVCFSFGSLSSFFFGSLIWVLLGLFIYFASLS